MHVQFNFITSNIGVLEMRTIFQNQVCLMIPNPNYMHLALQIWGHFVTTRPLAKSAEIYTHRNEHQIPLQTDTRLFV